MKKQVNNYILAIAFATAAIPSHSLANSTGVVELKQFEQNFTYFPSLSLVPKTIFYSALALKQQITTLYFPPAPILTTTVDGNIQTGAIPPKLADPAAVRSEETRGTTQTASKAMFGTVAFPLKRLGALKKFAPSFSQIKDGSEWNCPAGTCNAAALAIKASASRVAQVSLRDKLNDINATVNGSIRYSRDADTYQTTDNWAKPSETLKRQTGDCEDFAILKMAALHASGVSLDDMSIVVLYDQKRRFYHAVLSVSAGNRFYILDNMRNAVLSDDQLTDYVPLYSILNGRGYFHGLPVSRSKQMAGNVLPLEKVAPGEGSVP
ncbi:transglutaminase-like cysteine peptidase [Pararhizobium sp. DWP3-4]|uniref:transglutaminase-like cysteine peptidase n=1 Tax=Pararhizobium sp. DWP3-4 TaxID=2804565 RepID=UPI003CF4636D